MSRPTPRRPLPVAPRLATLAGIPLAASVLVLAAQPAPVNPVARLVDQAIHALPAGGRQLSIIGVQGSLLDHTWTVDVDIRRTTRGGATAIWSVIEPGDITLRLPDLTPQAGGVSPGVMSTTLGRLHLPGTGIASLSVTNHPGHPVTQLCSAPRPGPGTCTIFPGDRSSPATLSQDANLGPLAVTVSTP